VIVVTWKYEALLKSSQAESLQLSLQPQQQQSSLASLY